ncbi:hypothetical protein WAK64_18735 [Bacillus spongiae]|uniref:DUF4064 domain-containing protein n=1 Tax=Bacillus spongiae TaxID=2683610 RepID=A0ABU8HIR5_9BACI
MSAVNKISCGLCCISAGLVILFYVFLGLFISEIVDSAIEGIFNTPDAAVNILIALIIGILTLLIIGILALVVAFKLFKVAKSACS